MTLINPYNSSFISRFLSNVYCSCRSSTDRSSFQCEIKIFQFIVLFNDSIVKFRIIKFWYFDLRNRRFFANPFLRSKQIRRHGGEYRNVENVKRANGSIKNRTTAIYRSRIVSLRFNVLHNLSRLIYQLTLWDSCLTAMECLRKPRAKKTFERRDPNDLLKRSRPESGDFIRRVYSPHKLYRIVNR